MCVSVDSSCENCSYHIHKYSCKFNGIQRPFLLFKMNRQVVFGGLTYIREYTVCYVQLVKQKLVHARRAAVSTVQYVYAFRNYLSEFLRQSGTATSAA